MSAIWHRIGPVLTVVIAIFVLWYAGAVALNTPWALDKAKRAGVSETLCMRLSPCG